MIAYLFLISIPAIFSFIPVNKKVPIQKILLFLIAFVYIFFIGLRDKIGADWIAYSRMYDYISYGSLKNVIEYTEPSFALLNWSLAQFEIDIYGVNFIAAIIFVSGLVKFAAKMPNPGLALVSVTPYLVIAVGMSGVRQATAIGIVFILMAGWGKNSTIKNIILALLATSFHYSAFVSLLFVIQSMKMPKWVRWMILFSGGAVCFVIFSQTEQYAVYEQRYVTTNVVSPGALQHISLNAIPAMIYLLFIKKWNKVYGKSNLMLILSCLSVLSVAGVSVSSTAIDRLALYLSPIQMLVYSTIPIVFKNQLYSFGIIMMHIVILLIWFNYSNTASAFLPYNNILF